MRCKKGGDFPFSTRFCGELNGIIRFSGQKMDCKNENF